MGNKIKTSKETNSLSQQPSFILDVKNTLREGKDVYFSNKEQSQIEETLKGLFEALIDFHYNELERQIDFYTSLTKNFKGEKINPQIWETVLAVSEAYVKEAVVSSVNIVLGKLTNKLDTEFYPAQGKANPAKIKRLVKYANILKRIPVIQIVSTMTDILNIHSTIAKKLELERKNKQAESILTFSKFITGLKSRINSQRLNSKKKYLLDLFNSSDRPEFAYTSLLTLIEFMTIKRSGIGVYKKFDQTIINGIFNSFKINIIIEYVRNSKYKFTENGIVKKNDEFHFESISFSNSSLLALYKGLSDSNFTLFDLIFSEAFSRPVLPIVTLKVSWPTTSTRLTIKLNPHYMQSYLFSDGAYSLRGDDLAHFRTYLQKKMLKRGQSFEKEYYFFTPLSISTTMLNKLVPSKSGLKFKNENNLSLVDLAK